MKKFFNKKILVLFLCIFLLTGCTKTMTDRKGEVLVDPETETAIIDNIICKPVDTDLQEFYKNNGKSLKDLPECDNISVFKWRGIYDTFLIYPLSAVFVMVGTIFKRYVFAIILLAIASKIIQLILARSANEQNKILQRIQPEIDEINKRFAGRTDSASKIEKNDALQKLYMDNKIKPLAGLIAICLQLPLIIAFIEILYRLPVFSNESFFGLNLAISPTNGFALGNPNYLVLSLLLILLAFLQGIIKPDCSKITKRDLFMALIVVFIVNSFAWSLPCGVAIYFLTSYIIEFVLILIKRHRYKKKHPEE